MATADTTHVKPSETKPTVGLSMLTMTMMAVGSMVGARVPERGTKPRLDAGVYACAKAGFGE